MQSHEAPASWRWLRSPGADPSPAPHCAAGHRPASAPRPVRLTDGTIRYFPTATIEAFERAWAGDHPMNVEDLRETARRLLERDCAEASRRSSPNPWELAVVALLRPVPKRTLPEGGDGIRQPDGRGRVHPEPGPDLNTATNGTTGRDEKASRFLDELWADGLGWACLATLDGAGGGSTSTWPAERNDLLAQAMKVAEGSDVYVVPALRSWRSRRKGTAIPSVGLGRRRRHRRHRPRPPGPARRHDGGLRLAPVVPRLRPLVEVPEDVEELEVWNRRLARFLGGDAKHDASRSHGCQGRGTGTPPCRGSTRTGTREY